MPPVYPAGSYPAQVVADGAAAYWRLGETSGATAVEVIGGANGTISGGVTLNQAGALSDGDTAMVFNGTTGYISVPSSTAITPTGSFTVETWVKTLTATEVPLVEKFDAGNAGFMLSLNNFGGGNYYALWVGNGWVEGPGVVADGQWHHLVGVWNGTTVSLYLDGALRRSIAPTGVNLPATTHALEIARRWDVSTYSNASLDDVAIYKTALTAQQIALHYYLGQPRYAAGSYPDKVIRDGASAYWRLGETSGTTANDSIGTAHGTISGGVTLNQTGAIADGDKAMAFNGTGTIQTATPFTAPATFTIELWLKSVDENFSNILGNDTGASGTFLLAMGASAKLPYFAFNGATPTAIQDGIAISAAPTWQHLVIVSTPTRTLIYQNGGLRADQSHVKPVAISAPLFVTKNWLGSMDDVAIYPTALTPTQIAAHYQARLVGLYPAGSYPDKVIRDGASAYWRLGETSGTTAVDVIGGNNGTISGGVTLGQAGALADGDKAMRFDGVDDRVAVPTGAYQTFGTGPFTVECWCRLPGSPGEFKQLVDLKNDGSTNPGPHFFVTSSNFIFEVYNTLAAVVTIQYAGVAAAMANGQWQHLVGVLSRGPDELRLYLNGVLVAGPAVFPTGTSVTSTSGLGIGSASAALVDFFAGIVDEVAIYPTALTAPQIAAHYDARTFGGGGEGTRYSHRYRYAA
jgi:Concanavalin A-like lectin/glucanases superfamily